MHTIMKPSARDKQRAPGPSDLADKCDFCVARKIAASLGLADGGDRGFSLKAWLGTAVHEKLERELPKIYPNAELEITVRLGDIPGLGEVVGHVDLYFPDKAAINDWKTTDLDKLKKYRTAAGPSAYTQGLTAPERDELDQLKEQDRYGRLTEADLGRMLQLMTVSEQHSGGIPVEYVGQTMLYLYGLRNMGRPADYAVLTFIPRDSNNVSDIWVASCAYRPDVAEALLRRATRLAAVARHGRIEDVKPHPECFPCVIWPRLRR